MEEIENSLLNLSLHSGMPFTELKFMTIQQRKALHKQIQDKMDAESGKKKQGYL